MADGGTESRADEWNRTLPDPSSPAAGSDLTEPSEWLARQSAVRGPWWVRGVISAALLIAVSAGVGGCTSLAELQEKAAADAATAAARWEDPAVQARWASAVVGQVPLVDMPSDPTAGPALASPRRGLVELSPEIVDEGGHGLVDYASASDQWVETLGARATLRTVEVEQEGPCWNGGPCEEVRVTSATPTTMNIATARGTASVPAWSFAVEGLAAPLVLPAVVGSSAEDFPGHGFTSSSWLLGRDGSTLRVSLGLLYCTGAYQRHLLETDAVIVVWATAAPDDAECAVQERREETFALRAPIGDRPVIDQQGGLLLPQR